MPALRSFRVEGEGDAFRIHVEDASGGRITVSASRDDLEIIADTLDDILIGED